MMKYAYYPGCSLDSTGIEFNLSTKACAKAWGVELWEIPDWNCCGSSSAHVTNPWLALGLAARNLAIAGEAGLDVAIPCAACYARCKKAETAVRESAETRAKVEEIIGRPYKGESQARALVDIFCHDLGVEAIQQKVLRPLTGLKAVCYYGCLFVRPQKLAIDDAENPQMLDELTQALGAEALAWDYKTECCGGSLSACKAQAGYPMIERILDGAKHSGADCIITACPMCMANLDMRQAEIGKGAGKHYDLPVFYITELMGYAAGLESKELGIPRHFVPGEVLLGELAAKQRAAKATVQTGGEA